MSHVVHGMAGVLYGTSAALAVRAVHLSSAPESADAIGARRARNPRQRSAKEGGGNSASELWDQWHVVE